MPFWPFLMGYTALCVVWGVSIGKGAWMAPAALLGGYVAMRGVIWGLSPEVHEVAACLVWLVVAIILGSIGWPRVAVAFALSGLVYPAMLLMGERIVYLGLSPILAEAFAIAGLIGMGGGLYGMASLHHAADNRSGILSRGAGDPVALAQNQEGVRR